jgi:DNA-binding LytR/AlgR family response regulator
MRLFIAEDEPPALERLVDSIARVAPHARIVGSASSVRDVQAWFAANAPPDLLLLDIQLSDGLSLELFADGAVACPTIFTTAYDSFALAAFQAHAIDYLLKPIDEARLAQAFDKHARLRRHFVGEVAGLVAAFETGVLAAPSAAPPPHRLRMLGRKGTQWVAIAIADVACFVSVDKLSFALLATGDRYLVDSPLADIEHDLDPAQFFRANRQTIVNARSIARFRATGKGRLAVALTIGDDEVAVSPERAQAFREWLAK